jgi:hypothetical protein
MNNEEWRVVPDYQDYEVSSLGNVRSWKPLGMEKGRPLKARILAPETSWEGYRMAHLRNSTGRKRAKVAALVLLAFVGPRPNGMVVAHTNGNAIDDRLENVRYATQRENIHDKFRHGTVMFGEGHTNHKLTAEKVIAIRQSNKSHPATALEFGVSKSLVSAIRKRRIWKHIP